LFLIESEIKSLRACEKNLQSVPKRGVFETWQSANNSLKFSFKRMPKKILLAHRRPRLRISSCLTEKYDRTTRIASIAQKTLSSVCLAIRIVIAVEMTIIVLEAKAITKVMGGVRASREARNHLRNGVRKKVKKTKRQMPKTMSVTKEPKCLSKLAIKSMNKTATAITTTKEIRYKKFLFNIGNWIKLWIVDQDTKVSQKGSFLRQLINQSCK